MCGAPRTVLDIGGSSGYVSAELARRGAHVVVLDNDKDAIDEARSQGREAHLVDLTRDEPDLPLRSFDVLLCADVLEHLPDPATTLRRLSSYLSPSGRLVASVPNGANWSLRLALLAGQWNYKDRGLLDKTHLRNFTKSVFLKTLKEAGFDIVTTDLTCPIPIARGGRWSQAAYHIAQIRPGLLAFQHLAMARLAQPDEQATRQEPVKTALPL